MPRKGSRKTRTGCYTCRIRRVKCDENKPQCQKCTNSGRICDGYPPETQSSFLNLQRPRSAVASQVEGRAATFFRTIVGPALCTFAEPYFWNVLVLQFSQYEPAVRHAMVAISALYEQAQQSQSPISQDPRNNMIVQRYNGAIRALMASNKDESLVLLVCILFICIEFLQRNGQMATDHCRHGIQIFNNSGQSYPWIREHLLPILRRLSVMPLFHGSDVDTFPSLRDRSHDIAPILDSLERAQQSWDKLSCESITFIRHGDAYRYGLAPQSLITVGMREEQRRIQDTIEEWRDAFVHSPFAQASSGPRLPAVTHLLMQTLVVKIWVKMAFDLDETGYDKEQAAFQEIVDLASTSKTPMLDRSDSWSHPNFIFDMGFLPLLYFVIIKCRQLQIRRTALGLLKKLAFPRENLWDVNEMYCAGRRVIELEHGIDLETLDSSDVHNAGLHGTPSGKRVKDALFLSNGREFYGTGLDRGVRWKIRVITHSPSDGIEAFEEWLVISPA